MLLYLRIVNCRPHEFTQDAIGFHHSYYYTVQIHLNFPSSCANVNIYPYKHGTSVCLYLQER